MFTGLIESIGTVEQFTAGPLTDVWIGTSIPTAELQVGESIACDGVCLTVVELAPARFRVQASPETVRRTTVGQWRVGTEVNLERALRLSDRLGGHLVQGHVDAVARIVEKRPEGGSVVMAFSLPQELAPYFVEKGSVAVDGISLTINQLDVDRFRVALIFETQKRTTLAKKHVGAHVNIEADLVGKYIARMYSLARGGSGR